jgi:hypothetical protein
MRSTYCPFGILLSLSYTHKPNWLYIWEAHIAHLAYCSLSLIHTSPIGLYEKQILPIWHITLSLTHTQGPIGLYEEYVVTSCHIALSLSHTHTSLIGCTSIEYIIYCSFSFVYCLSYNQAYTHTQTLPLGSQTLPLGSQTLPLGSQTLPLGSQTLPLGSQTLPIGSQTLPLGLQTLPLGISPFLSHITLYSYLAHFT